MTTTPSAVTGGAPHPAWYARAGTWFLKIGRAVKTALQKIAGEMPAVNAEIQKVAPTVEALSEMVLKGSSTFEQHLLDVWGAVAKAVKDAGAAAGGSGLSVSLDQSLVNDIKNFLPQVEAYLDPKASPTPPTQ